MGNDEKIGIDEALRKAMSRLDRLGASAELSEVTVAVTTSTKSDPDSSISYVVLIETYRIVREKRAFTSVDGLGDLLKRVVSALDKLGADTPDEWDDWVTGSRTGSDGSYTSACAEITADSVRQEGRPPES